MLLTLQHSVYAPCIYLVGEAFAVNPCDVERPLLTPYVWHSDFNMLSLYGIMLVQ